MASLIDLLSSSLDRDSVSRMGEIVGKDTKTTQDAINSALPLLVVALKKSTERDAGDGLARALEDRHGGGILDNLSGYLSNYNGVDGRGILKHVLGERHESAAQALQATSGVNKEQAGSLLTMLAPLVLGALGKSRQSGASGPEVSRILDEEARAMVERSPGVLSSFTRALDADGDGDTDIKDVLSIGAKMFGGMFR